MTRFLTGHGVPPQLVGLVRGALLAAGIAACEAILAGIDNLPVHGIWLYVLPAFGYSTRQFESILDGFKAPAPDPTKAQMAAQPAATNTPAGPTP